MKINDINIRDPFVLPDNGKYYMYGTRAKNFGVKTEGFDVYISDDLKTWSEPIECFNSALYGFNKGVNWAPEVHKYNLKYYMCATFTQENGLRGTYILKSDSPAGPFVLHSTGAVTPAKWECLDGTLYFDNNNKPYMVFCHEHTQIINGTVCCIQLADDLSHSVGDAVTLFAGSEPYYCTGPDSNGHYITDGPFMYTTKNNTLLMMWSTFINKSYAQCIARSDTGSITGPYTHLEPLITDDGGHGMIFKTHDELMLTFHTPNQTGKERPRFMPIKDSGDIIQTLT